MHIRPHSPGTNRLVIVDAKLDDYACLSELARSGELRVTLSTTGSGALRLAPSFADAVWLVCPQLPDMSGLDLLEMLRSLSSLLQVVVIDDEYDRHHEMQALQGGAVQYVCKPMHASWLASWRQPPRAASPGPTQRPSQPGARYPLT